MDRQRPQVLQGGSVARSLIERLVSQPAQTVFPNRKLRRLAGMTPGQVAVGAADYLPCVDLKGEETL